MIVSRKRNLSHNESSSLDSSSCSSLNSTTSDSASPQPSRASFGLVATTTTRPTTGPPGVGCASSGGSSLKIVPSLVDRQQLNLELKMLVENEFLFCLNSLDAFNKTKCLTKRLDSRKMCNFIIKNDHLYRIVKYLIQLFETVQPNASSQPILSTRTHSRSCERITSWTVYLCLLNMKFDVNDKIKYINQMNASSGRNDSVFYFLVFYNFVFFIK